MAEAALAGGLDRGTRGDRYQVVVHVEAGVLEEEGVPAGTSRPGQSAFENGAHVPAGTSQRIACDASKIVMTHDVAGNILDVGRKTRIISPPCVAR